MLIQIPASCAIDGSLGTRELRALAIHCRAADRKTGEHFCKLSTLCERYGGGMPESELSAATKILEGRNLLKRRRRCRRSALTTVIRRDLVWIDFEGFMHKRMKKTDMAVMIACGKFRKALDANGEGQLIFDNNTPDHSIAALTCWLGLRPRRLREVLGRMADYGVIADHGDMPLEPLPRNRGVCWDKYTGLSDAQNLPSSRFYVVRFARTDEPASQNARNTEIISPESIENTEISASKTHKSQCDLQGNTYLQGSEHLQGSPAVAERPNTGGNELDFIHPSTPERVPGDFENFLRAFEGNLYGLGGPPQEGARAAYERAAQRLSPDAILAMARRLHYPDDFDGPSTAEILSMIATHTSSDVLRREHGPSNC